MSNIPVIIKNLSGGSETSDEWEFVSLMTYSYPYQYHKPLEKDYSILYVGTVYGEVNVDNDREIEYLLDGKKYAKIVDAEAGDTVKVGIGSGRMLTGWASNGPVYGTGYFVKYFCCGIPKE